MRALASSILVMSAAVMLMTGCEKPPAQPPSEQPAETQPEPAPEPEPEPTETCDFTADPNKTYVGESPEQCQVIKFACDEGKQYFADDCGCGCEVVP